MPTDAEAWQPQTFANKLRAEKWAKLNQRRASSNPAHSGSTDDAERISKTGDSLSAVIAPKSELNANAAEFVPYSVRRASCSDASVTSSINGTSPLNGIPPLKRNALYNGDSTHRDSSLSDVIGCAALNPTDSGAAGYSNGLEAVEGLTPGFLDDSGAFHTYSTQKDDYAASSRADVDRKFIAPLRYERLKLLKIYMDLQKIHGTIPRPACLPRIYDDDKGIFEPSKWIEDLWRREQELGYGSVMSLTKCYGSPLSGQRNGRFINRNVVDAIKDVKI